MPPPPVYFAQNLQNIGDRSGPRVRIGEKVLFSKNISRKIFKLNHFARLGWPGRGGFLVLDLVLPPASIIWGVSSMRRGILPFGEGRFPDFASGF